MDSMGYLTLGYAIIWVALAVYLLSLNRRIGRVREDLEDLSLRVKRAGRDELDD